MTDFKKNDVVRYIGREYPGARGQLFRVCRGGDGGGSVQLGTMKDGMAVRNAKGADGAWWVPKKDVELVGVGIDSIGRFESSELDALAKHEHEHSTPTKVTLAPPEAPEPPEQRIEQPPASEEPPAETREPQAIVERRDGISEVWMLTVCAGSKRIVELYSAEDRAEDRRQDVSGVLGSLDIEYVTECRRMEVR